MRIIGVIWRRGGGSSRSDHGVMGVESKNATRVPLDRDAALRNTVHVTRDMQLSCFPKLSF
jgi:hypothetical protein